MRCLSARLRLRLSLSLRLHSSLRCIIERSALSVQRREFRGRAWL